MSRSCTVDDSVNPPPVPADRMAENEFQAAEILAGLSKCTLPPSSREASLGGEAGESVDSWGSRCKRSSTVRVKSESALNYASSSAVEEEPEKKPMPLAFDLNEDQATTCIQEEEYRRELNVVKSEDADMAEASPVCTSSKAGVKSRQCLTEAEKEARRLRRVLANRESARQTIRRRQLLYEELTRKVAGLVRDNENLKKEKESVGKDYDALRCTNKMLNEQVAEQLGSQPGENVGKSLSANCSVPLPFPNYPYIICKDTPFVCPYNVQLSDINPSQLGHLARCSFPRDSEAKPAETRSFQFSNAEGNPLSNSGPSGHWCMMPYPLYFPIADAKNGRYGPNLIPFFPSGDKEYATGITAECPKKLLSECPIDVKTEFPSSSELQAEKDSREIPIGTFSLAVSVDSEATPINGVRDAKVVQDSHQEPGLKNGKRLVDPAVAKKARKRRKELTRMKSMHCRSHREEGFRLGESPPWSRNA